MPTATDTLMADARCIEICIPGEDMKLAVLISLFARIAGVSANTDSLIAGAGCIADCIPGADMKLAVLISLAQQSALPVPNLQFISPDAMSWAAPGVTPATWTLEESASASSGWFVQTPLISGNTISGVDGNKFFRITGYNAAGVAVTSVSNVVFVP